MTLQPYCNCSFSTKNDRRHRRRPVKIQQCFQKLLFPIEIYCCAILGTNLRTLTNVFESLVQCQRVRRLLQFILSDAEHETLFRGWTQHFRSNGHLVCLGFPVHVQRLIAPFHRHADRLEDFSDGRAHHRLGVLAFYQGHAQGPRLLVAAIRLHQPEAATRLLNNDCATAILYNILWREASLSSSSWKASKKRIFNRTRTEILTTNNTILILPTCVIILIIYDFRSNYAYQQILLHRDRRINDEILKYI